mgnify:FL=1
MGFCEMQQTLTVLYVGDGSPVPKRSGKIGLSACGPGNPAPTAKALFCNRPIQLASLCVKRGNFQISG